MNSAGKIQSTVNVVNVTNGVASGELVLSGASATELISSFVQASIGVGTGGTSASNTSSDNSRNTISENNKEHIFREAEGHFAEDTPQNRKIIENVANDKTII